MLERITIPQSRYLIQSTSAQYTTHCKSLHIEPKTLQVESKHGKVSAHWLGDPAAETVILYFHGGGYTQSASVGNFRYMTRLIKDLNTKKEGRSIAALVLAYTLAPEATHPTQLHEAAAVLAHLLQVRGYSPSSIIISGDSAGGNLALALLSHLLHPHPDVPSIELHQPLGGALLYSPWAGFSTTYPSFSNEKLDVLSPVALRRWSAMFLDKANPINPETDPGPISGDAWTESCRNPASWWNLMQNIVSDILIPFGSNEVLADSIRELEGELKKGWVNGGGDVSRVVFLDAPNEAHIAPIADIMIQGAEVKSSTQIVIEEWMKARLQC